jgi:hypothetical protein
MAIDKIQPLKLEDPSTGGTETDEFPTEANPQEDHVESAGIVIDDAIHRDEKVRIWRLNNDMLFADGNNPSPVTLSQLLAGGSGLTEAQHRDLNTLVHELDRDSYDEITYNGDKIIRFTSWIDATKMQKIQEFILSYIGGRVSQVVSTQYDNSGVLKAQMTETFTYSGSRVIAIARVRDL